MAKKKQTKRATKRASTSDAMVTIKLSKTQKSTLEAQARKYAKGNLSLWLRYAGAHHKPVRAITF